MGTRTRVRKCNNPAPMYGGKKCKGDLSFTVRCKLMECPGNFIRDHYIFNLSENTFKYFSSSFILLFPLFFLVNGGFSQWSSFSACSKTCDDGVQVRTRSCTKPRPAHGGRKCVGAVKISKSCKIKDCASKCSIFSIFQINKGNRCSRIENTEIPTLCIFCNIAIT